MGPFRKQTVDDRLSSAILMTMTKRDKHGRALTKPWQGQFHRFLVEKRLVSEDKAKYFAGWVERFIQTAKVIVHGVLGLGMPAGTPRQRDDQHSILF